MNDRIRRQVRQLMRERGITQEQLASQTGIAAHNISRMLREGGQGVGIVPDNWKRLLSALGQELTVTGEAES